MINRTISALLRPFRRRLDALPRGVSLAGPKLNAPRDTLAVVHCARGANIRRLGSNSTSVDISLVTPRWTQSSKVPCRFLGIPNDSASFAGGTVNAREPLQVVLCLLFRWKLKRSGRIDSSVSENSSRRTRQPLAYRLASCVWLHAVSVASYDFPNKQYELPSKAVLLCCRGGIWT